MVENWVAKALGGALPTQEWGTLFTGLAGNRHHKRLAWEMLTTHWDALFRVWGQSQFKMKSILAASMAHADADEVQVFFDSHPCHSAFRKHCLGTGAWNWVELSISLYPVLTCIRSSMQFYSL